VSFTVETYYPAFRGDRINSVGYPQSYGQTSSFYNSDGTVTPSNTYSINNDYTMIYPRKTRWFSNILKAREKSTNNIIISGTPSII
jgi:hypothetical protein